MAVRVCTWHSSHPVRIESKMHRKGSQAINFKSHPSDTCFFLVGTTLQKSAFSLVLMTRWKPCGKREPIRIIYRQSMAAWMVRCATNKRSHEMVCAALSVALKAMLISSWTVTLSSFLQFFPPLGLFLDIQTSFLTPSFPSTPWQPCSLTPFSCVSVQPRSEYAAPQMQMLMAMEAGAGNLRKGT